MEAITDRRRSESTSETCPVCNQPEPWLDDDGKCVMCGADEEAVQEADEEDEAKPTVRLVGADGNAFNILGLCYRAARRAGWTQERIDEFKGKATAGDYNHLLGVCCEYFDVR